MRRSSRNSRTRRSQVSPGVASRSGEPRSKVSQFSQSNQVSSGVFRSSLGSQAINGERHRPAPVSPA